MRKPTMLSILALTALLLLSLLCGCSCTGKTNTPTETDSEAPSQTQTEPVQETDPATEPATDPETMTETETEPETEPETESETISREDYVYGNDIVVTPVITKEMPVDHITLLGHELTDFSIILPAETDHYTADAGNYIRDRFLQAVGIDVPVIREYEACTTPCEIVIGVTNRDTDAVRARRDALNSEGYYLYAEGNRLFIGGAENRSTYYASMSFLEDYIGCRWFTPDCIAVLEAGEIAVPADLDVSRTPDLTFRRSYYQFVDGHYTKMYKLNPLTYAGGSVHTLRTLAEMQNFQIGDQPCMTDPAVYETVLRNVLAALRSRPDATVISVSQNDSYEQQLGCQCDNCRALNEKYGCEGGALFDFVNRIARDIKDEFPDVMVETLAYRYSIAPPKDMVFEDNVMIMLCTIELCCNHAIDDPDCPANYRYATYLEAWSKICSHLSIWDYHTSFADYQIPFPNETMLYDQIVYYAKHNAISLFSEGNYNSRSGQFEEMRAFACSRLMWNTDMTREEYEKSINDFLMYYYGDGWVYIRRYMDVMQELASKDGRHYNLWANARTVIDFTRDLPERKYLLAAITGLFEKAEAAATTDAQKAHVRKASIQAYYYAASNSASKTYREKYDELMKEFNIQMQNEGAPYVG